MSPVPQEEWRPRGEKRKSSRERDGRNERDRIHERSEQERPGRVLFCRNIQVSFAFRRNAGGEILTGIDIVPYTLVRGREPFPTLRRSQACL